MATILQFAPTKPEGRTCPDCEGSGWFTSLAQAEGEVRYWRSRWESVQAHPRARKERQTCAENLEFWTNKAAMYAAMRKAR